VGRVVANGKAYKRRGKLGRAKGRRPPYPRILITCEGKKTEPLYFEDIRKKNRVPSAHVRVLHSDFGTEPRQVVDFAESKFLETREFEWVFAVFDRDDHRTYHNALARARALDKKLKNNEKRTVRFLAIPSVPCFELWLLLHFVNHQTFCHRDELLSRLRQHVPGYSKGQVGVFALTEPGVAAASARAEWLRRHFSPRSGTDPYTDVDCLVAMLLKMTSTV
jgi:RloB-like protein